MLADTSTAVSQFVSFLDNDGRVALAGALYDASSQHWTWMEEYRRADGDHTEAIEYHRKHWRDLGDAAEYVSKLVVFTPA